jgi:hypothetical protein
MKFISQVKVTGMKPSKGVLENGTTYNSTKVYVETALDDTKGKGFATAEYNFGEASEYDKYRHLTFPFLADVEMEITSSGKTQKTVVRGVKPVANAKAA